MAASKAPGMPRKRVVSKRIRAVQADGHAPHSAIDDHARDLLGDQGAIRGQSHAQTLVRAVTRQLENIRTEKRFATAQHQDGSGHSRNLIDDVARSLGGEVGGRTQFRGAGPAVNAAKIAAFGELPEDQSGLVLVYLV